MLVAIMGLALAGSSPDPLMSAWMQCLADEAERFASSSSEAADVTADAVMGACSAQEEAFSARQLRRAPGAMIGQMAEAQRDNRARVKQMVISRIMDMRASR